MTVLKKIDTKAFRYSLFVSIFFILGKCAMQKPIITSIEPKHFSIQIPFQSDSKGIILPTYWGPGKKEYKLYLDNHSPSWVNDSILRNNASVSKSKDFLYSTRTADGKKIKGDVYICDSISLGKVGFSNVAFYNISNETNAGKTDGVIGENMMTEGIWKIDFEDNMITFASSIDSLKWFLKESESLHAVFTDKGIEIEITFSNTVKKKFELDLGFNGSIIMPEDEFASITGTHTKVFNRLGKFSTPASAVTIESHYITDSIKAGNYYFDSHFVQPVSTNEMVKEKLIGLGFFKQFGFLIIDYKNKAVYLSKYRLLAVPEMN
jgi:hypothetical protein